MASHKGSPYEPLLGSALQIKYFSDHTRRFHPSALHPPTQVSGVGKVWGGVVFIVEGEGGSMVVIYLQLLQRSAPVV
jgi:hypothetical protein